MPLCLYKGTLLLTDMHVMADPSCRRSPGHNPNPLRRYSSLSFSPGTARDRERRNALYKILSLFFPPLIEDQRKSFTLL